MIVVKGSRASEGTGFRWCQALRPQAGCEYKWFRRGRGCNVWLQMVDQDDEEYETQELEELHNDT